MNPAPRPDEFGNITLRSKHDANIAAALLNDNGRIRYLIWVRNPIERVRSAYEWHRLLILMPVPATMTLDQPCEQGLACPSPAKMKLKLKKGRIFTKRYERAILSFTDANAFAEALSERTQKGDIARNLARVKLPFTHMSKGIGFYLWNGDFVRRYHRYIDFVGSVEHIDKDMQRLQTRKGWTKRNSTSVRVNAAHTVTLSSLAKRNLFWMLNATDYAALRELVSYQLLDASRYYEYMADLPKEFRDAAGKEFFHFSQLMAHGQSIATP